MSNSCRYRAGTGTPMTSVKAGRGAGRMWRPILFALLLASGLTSVGVAQNRRDEALLKSLVEAYGPSGAEGPVREVVRAALPAWARPTEDSAGNLWISVGEGDPVVVFIAHLDEIGWRVTGINPDGRLTLRRLGGFFPSLYHYRPALIHAGPGPIAGVFVPADSGAVEIDLGVLSRAAAESLGVRIGQTATMPKSYQRLAGTRATGRSFDDRVGSTALLLAVQRLDPERLKHRVVFIWSVREEVGLEGAGVAADALGTTAARVHAIDTFVTADGPLESPTYGLAPVGGGAVIRAVDNSNVAPAPLVDSLLALAARKQIALQLGTTSGGNDGSAFAPWGVPDVPIGWPLRYSHSPVEVIDLNDLDALARIVQAVAEEW